MEHSKIEQFPNTASASASADRAATELKSGIMEDAHDLTDEAKRVAGGMISQARESAGGQIASGKDRVAVGLASVADALRHTGEHLRSTDAPASLDEYAAQAADKVQSASAYLKDNTLSDVLADVGSFARREPAMFLGGAFVLGLVGGRFLKSSAPQKAPKSSASQVSAGSPRALPGRQMGSFEQSRPSAGARQQPSVSSPPRAASGQPGRQPNQSDNGAPSRQGGSQAALSTGDGAELHGAE